MDMETLKQGVIFFIVLIFSLGIHECAHAWVALKLGDSTAYEQGRVSLNPLNHLDPVGTLFLIIVSLAGMGIGWAKPVPVNPYNLKQYDRDTMMISVAGPLSNLLFAGLFFAVYAGAGILLKQDVPISSSVVKALTDFIVIGVFCNISLFIFNMLPFVPLDGSKVYTFFLPPTIRTSVNAFLFKIGYWPLLILLATEYMFEGYGILSMVFRPVSALIVSLFSSISEIIGA